MRPRLLLALALLVPAALAQRAPDGSAPGAADRQYHAGAQAYIGGDLERAAASVRAGLAQDPDHPRLQALRDLIEQDQEEQDQRDGGQEREQGEGQQDGSAGSEGEPNEGEQGDRQSGEGEAPPPDEPEAAQDQTRTGPQTPDQPEDGAAPGRRPGEGGATPEGGGHVPDGQMSRAQAARILDAVGGDERLLLREIRRAPGRGRPSEKDW